MDSLEEPFRATLRAHHAEGLSIAQIAEREGIAADTARWRLRRGHELTREVLLRRDRRGWLSELGALLPFGLGRRSGEGMVPGARASRWLLPALLASAGFVALTSWLVLRTPSSQGQTGSAIHLARGGQADPVAATTLAGGLRALPPEHRVESSSRSPEPLRSSAQLPQLQPSG